MSNMHDVCAEVKLRGEATIYDLAPAFPEMTLQQIKNALRNGKTAKLVKVVRMGERRLPKDGAGAEPGVWGPRTFEDELADDAPIRKVDTTTWKRPVSFVFNLGSA